MGVLLHTCEGPTLWRTLMRSTRCVGQIGDEVRGRRRPKLCPDSASQSSDLGEKRERERTKTRRSGSASSRRAGCADSRLNPSSARPKPAGCVPRPTSGPCSPPPRSALHRFPPTSWPQQTPTAWAVGGGGVGPTARCREDHFFVKTQSMPNSHLFPTKPGATSTNTKEIRSRSPSMVLFFVRIRTNLCRVGATLVQDRHRGQPSSGAVRSGPASL